MGSRSIHQRRFYISVVFFFFFSDRRRCFFFLFLDCFFLSFLLCNVMYIFSPYVGLVRVFFLFNPISYVCLTPCQYTTRVVKYLKRRLLFVSRQSMRSHFLNFYGRTPHVKRTSLGEAISKNDGLECFLRSGRLDSELL